MCCCQKKNGHWLRTVEILSYSFTSQGRVLLVFNCEGKMRSAYIAQNLLGVLASRLGKTVVQILTEQV